MGLQGRCGGATEALPCSWLPGRLGAPIGALRPSGAPHAGVGGDEQIARNGGRLRRPERHRDPGAVSTDQREQQLGAFAGLDQRQGGKLARGDQFGHGLGAKCGRRIVAAPVPVSATRIFPPIARAISATKASRPRR